MTSRQPVLYQVSPDDMSLDAKEAETFNALLRTWQEHLGSNLRNEAYYRGKMGYVTRDGQMPRELRKLKVVMGWGGKCVDVLANRSVLRGFAGSDARRVEDAMGDVDPVELYEQAVVSELADSCAFVTVSRGLPGEPPAVVSAHSALDAAAIWDERRKRIRAGMCVIDVEEDETGLRVPTWVTMYTDSRVYSCRRQRGGVWCAEAADNPFGRPPMEALRYRPTLARPFGRSRITPAVRSLIDRAIAVGGRTEVTAMFYTWPQRYLLGIDRKTAEGLAKRKVEVYADSMMLVTPNKNGDVPQLGQLAQATMQPHIDHLEMLGKQFASEACLPLDEVGIVFDNPTSSEAMEAAQKRLLVEAEHVNRMNGASLRRVAAMAVATAEGAPSLDLAIDARADFAPVLKPSASAAADFAVKVASVAPGYALTEQFWADLGYADPAAMARDVRVAQGMAAAQQAAAQAALPGATAAALPAARG